MKMLQKILEASLVWRTIGGLTRETHISEKDIALIVLKNPTEFNLVYPADEALGAPTLIKRKSHIFFDVAK